MEKQLLDGITWPADLKRLAREELPQVAEEIRSFILDGVSRTGGHLGSGMGAVELTLALHYLFDFREDRLVFDVGHQCYPHKILTGRKAQFHTLRQKGGISGFTNRFESPYDVFMSSCRQSPPAHRQVVTSSVHSVMSSRCHVLGAIDGPSADAL